MNLIRVILHQNLCNAKKVRIFVQLDKNVVNLVIMVLVAEMIKFAAKIKAMENVVIRDKNVSKVIVKMKLIINYRTNYCYY